MTIRIPILNYVSLVWKKENGTTVELPISDFLKRSEFADTPAEEKGKNRKFPEAFLFAGSHLGDPAGNPRKHLAELSGNVISISTFGDELLCLPDYHAQENHALAWQIDSTRLPKLNSKVALRLRTVKPKGNPEEKATTKPEEPGTVIHLVADGTIKIGGGKVDLTQLHEKLTTLAAQNKNQPVVIRSDGEVTYNRIVKVIDTCQKAGIGNISFATQ